MARDIGKATIDTDLTSLRILTETALSLRVAIRRTLRVGKNSGVPLEDLGISLTKERRYHMTRNDVLGDNFDLMEFAASS